jgi:hypothetical protein
MHSGQGLGRGAGAPLRRRAAGRLHQNLADDLVKNTPKGKLANPYKDTQADVVAQGGSFC